MISTHIKIRIDANVATAAALVPLPGVVDLGIFADLQTERG